MRNEWAYAKVVDGYWQEVARIFRESNNVKSLTEAVDMMQILHPTYTLRIVITDRIQQPTPGTEQLMVGVGRSDSFKYYNPSHGEIGCNAVLHAVEQALATAGVNATVTFERFEHRT